MLQIKLAGSVHQKRRYHVLLTGVMITVFLFPTFASGWTYYRWEDERGIVHLTNNFARVPHAYRQQVEVIGPRRKTIRSATSGTSAAAVAAETNARGEELSGSVEGSSPAEGEQEEQSQEGSGQRERPIEEVLQRQIELQRGILERTDREEVREAVKRAIREKEEELRRHQALEGQ